MGACFMEIPTEGHFVVDGHSPVAFLPSITRLRWRKFTAQRTVQLELKQDHTGLYGTNDIQF